MVIDTSALIAILQDEPEAGDMRRSLVAEPEVLLSAGTYLEAAMVAEGKRGEEGGKDLDLLLHEAGVVVVAFSPEHAEIARAAFRHYGKGRHRAGLNFGDCISYALAKARSEPLLFKGDDFNHTDLARRV